MPLAVLVTQWARRLNAAAAAAACPQAAGQPLLPLGEGLACLGCGANCASPQDHRSNGAANGLSSTGVLGMRFSWPAAAAAPTGPCCVVVHPLACLCIFTSTLAPPQLLKSIALPPAPSLSCFQQLCLLMDQGLPPLTAALYLIPLSQTPFRLAASVPPHLLSLLPALSSTPHFPFKLAAPLFPPGHEILLDLSRCELYCTACTDYVFHPGFDLVLQVRGDDAGRLEQRLCLLPCLLVCLEHRDAVLPVQPS
jgi:hypothetical protein